MLTNQLIFLIGNSIGTAAGAGVGLWAGLKLIKKAVRKDDPSLKDISDQDLTDSTVKTAEKLAADADDDE